MLKFDIKQATFFFKNNGVFWICCVFAIVIISRWWLGAITPFDSKDEYYPLLQYAVTQIENGNNPFWNAAHFSGFPVAGDPQSLVFSPLMIAGMMIFGKTPFVFDILVYVHLFLGAVVLYFFAKHKQTPWHIGFLVAVIFAFGSVVSGRLQHTPIIVAYSYFAMFFCVYSYRNYSLFNMHICGLLLGLTLAHINQVVFILCLFCLFWFGYLLYTEENRKRLLLFSAGVGLVALAIAAIPLYNIIATKADSIRGVIDYTMATWNSPSPKMLLTMVFPNINHNIMGQYPGPLDMTETFLHIGLIPFLLILHAMFFEKKTRKNLHASLIVGALFVLSLLFALGKNGGVFPLYYVVPGADNFKRPSDFLYLSNLLFCLWLVFSWKDVNQDGKLSCHKLTVYLCVTAVGLLLSTNAENRLNSTRHLDLYYQSASHQEIVDVIKSDYRDALGVPYRLETLGVDMYWANYAVNDGIYLVYGYNPMAPTLLSEVYGIPASFAEPKQFTQYYKSFDDWLPKLMGVQYLLTSHPPSDHDKDNAKALLTIDNATLYKLGKPYDRVLNPQLRLPSALTVEELNRVNFKNAYISDNTALDQCQGEVTIDKVIYDGAGIEIKYRSKTGGLLTVNEIYNARIAAEIDNESVDVHKINYMMRGVCVPPGEHNLVMGYRILPRLCFFYE